MYTPHYIIDYDCITRMYDDVTTDHIIKSIQSYISCLPSKCSVSKALDISDSFRLNNSGSSTPKIPMKAIVLTMYENTTTKKIISHLQDNIPLMTSLYRSGIEGVIFMLDTPSANTLSEWEKMTVLIDGSEVSFYRYSPSTFKVSMISPVMALGKNLLVMYRLEESGVLPSIEHKDIVLISEGLLLLGMTLDTGYLNFLSQLISVSSKVCITDVARTSIDKDQIQRTHAYHLLSYYMKRYSFHVLVCSYRDCVRQECLSSSVWEIKKHRDPIRTHDVVEYIGDTITLSVEDNNRSLVKVLTSKVDGLVDEIATLKSSLLGLTDTLSRSMSTSTPISMSSQVIPSPPEDVYVTPSSLIETTVEPIVASTPTVEPIEPIVESLVVSIPTVAPTLIPGPIEVKIPTVKGNTLLSSLSKLDNTVITSTIPRITPVSVRSIDVEKK